MIESLKELLPQQPQLPSVEEDRKTITSHAIAVMELLSKLSPRRREAVLNTVVAMSNYESHRGLDEREAAINAGVNKAHSIIDMLTGGGSSVASSVSKAVGGSLSKNEVEAILRDDEVMP